MANPSTTGPSGIGSEVLRRVQFNGLSDTTTDILTVGTDMIVTVLMISICDLAGASSTCDIRIAPDGSGFCYFMNSVSLPAYGSFLWNDRFVITETDILKVGCSSTNHDIYCSYIEQEFA